MLNKLLQRQIQKHFGSPDKISPDLTSFLGVISESYNYYEKDRKMLEHSIDLSSNEMIELNADLRKEADELQKAHKELTRVFHSVEEGFYAMDATTWQYTHVSTGCEKIYGYTSSDFYANPMLWYQVILPEDKVIIARNNEKVNRGEQVVQQFRITHKDQSIRWLESKVIPSMDESGKLIRIDGIVNDITEKKIAERKVAESEKQYRDLFENSPMPMWVLDVNSFKFLDVNEAAIRCYGYSRLEFLSMSALDIKPEDEKNRFLDVARTHFSGIYSMITTLLKKDGTVICAEVNANEIIFEGKMARLVVSNDITEKMKAEELLQLSERNFREFFESAPDGIGIVDLDTGKYVDCNANTLRMFNYSKEQFVQLSQADMSPELQPDGSNSLSKAMEFIRLAMAGEKPVFEWVYQDSSGNPFNCEVRLSRLSIPGRNLLRASIVDISDKKLAEENLAEAHRELTKLFNSIDQVLFSVDMTKYQTIQMSPACEKVYGYQATEFFTNSNLWKEVIHPDDISFMEKDMPIWGSGKPASNQYRINHKEKGWRWIETTVMPTLDENGNLIRLDGVTTDIHDRKVTEELLKQSEEGYRLICSNPMLGVTWASTDGKMIKANEAFANMMGYTVDELAGMHFAQFTYPDELQRDRPLIEKLFRGEIGNFRCEQKYLTKNKEIIWGEVNLNAIRDEQGIVQYSIGVVQDITARKLAEAELLASHASLEMKVKERTSELEASNKELEAFGYSVSHDLRAPLRVINGYGQMLVSDCADKLNEEEKDCLRVIMTNAQRMGQLIDDLLNFSRLGRESLVKKHVNMHDVVKVVIEELKAGNQSAPEIILHDLPYSDCDLHLTKQVWINLISNAIKYSSKSDHPHIEIGTQGHNGSLTYYIKDNGAGFDMKHAGKLFGVFQRLHKAKDYEGTGVGLALSHRIVTMHGGKIWAQAKLNEGATFYFTLPKTKNLN